MLGCISSVYEQTKKISFEIILVDNNSEDNCKELVLQKFPAVLWLQTGYNAGFARANNQGIKIANGENVLLLNADTIVLDGALDKAIALFKNDDVIGCGVQLLNNDGTHQISGAHFVKGGLNFLLPLPYLGRFIRYWGYKLNTRVPSIIELIEGHAQRFPERRPSAHTRHSGYSVRRRARSVARGRLRQQFRCLRDLVPALRDHPELRGHARHRRVDGSAAVADTPNRST